MPDKPQNNSPGIYDAPTIKASKATSQSDFQDEMIGKVLDRKYKILHRLGAGAMGVVYEAWHLELEKSFAVKSILPEYTENLEAQEDLRKEPKVQGKLKHPNIIPVTDTCSDDHGRFYFVMEYEEGQNLLDLINEKNFSEDEALAIIIDILEALDHAHSKGIVHRDIKPRNIMVTRENTARLTDFGIAILMADRDNDGNQEFTGTLSYASPEQLDNASAVDHRSDIFSVGIVLYQLLTRTIPFEGATKEETKQNIRTQPVPDINAALPDTFPGLSEIINKALEKNPENRFQDCRSFIDAIEAYHRKTHVECRRCRHINRVKDKYNLKNERCEKCGKKLKEEKALLVAALIMSITIILGYYFYPWPGSLDVKTTPDGSTVYINDQKHGELTPLVVSLPPGKYQIRIVNNDKYETVTQEVDLTKRETETINLKLPEKDIDYKKGYNAFKKAWRTAGDICMQFFDISEFKKRLKRAENNGWSAQIKGYTEKIQERGIIVEKLWQEYIEYFNELKMIKSEIRQTSYEKLANDMAGQGDLSGLSTVQRHFQAYLSNRLDLSNQLTMEEIMTFCEVRN